MLVPSTSERHLSDLSDTSFQIPLGADFSDLLLASNDVDDFLKGSNDYMDTPAPEKTEREPLTLSQLTPRPKPRSDFAVTMKSVSSTTFQKPNLQIEPARDESKNQPTIAGTKIIRYQTTRKVEPKPMNSDDCTAPMARCSSGQPPYRRMKEAHASASSQSAAAELVLPNIVNSSVVAPQVAHPLSVKNHKKPVSF